MLESVRTSAAASRVEKFVDAGPDGEERAAPVGSPFLGHAVNRGARNHRASEREGAVVGIEEREAVEKREARPIRSDAENRADLF